MAAGRAYQQLFGDLGHQISASFELGSPGQLSGALQMPPCGYPEMSPELIGKIWRKVAACHSAYMRQDLSPHGSSVFLGEA